MRWTMHRIFSPNSNRCDFVFYTLFTLWFWFGRIYNRQKCLKVNAVNEMLSRKEHIFLIGIIDVAVLLSILSFKSRFIIFALNAFLILVIYEAFRQFFMYLSVKNWQRNKLHSLAFHIDEKEEISWRYEKSKALFFCRLNIVILIKTKNIARLKYLLMNRVIENFLKVCMSPYQTMDRGA